MKRTIEKPIPRAQVLPVDLYTDLHGLIAASRERLAQRGVFLDGGEDE